MNSITKRFLDDYFKRELTGLNELIGINVLDKWFPKEIEINENTLYY